MVTGKVTTGQLFKSLTLTVYVPAGNPVNTPVAAPVTLPGISFSKYEYGVTPPPAVTVRIPSLAPLQDTWRPL
jgi:hypothetical protein